MKILLIKYNKITDQSFDKFTDYCKGKADIITTDLKTQGRMMDIMIQRKVNAFLKPLRPFDAVVIGDIFWRTGRNICSWCKERSIPSFFLQHGQWIYTKNKENPREVPTCTCFMGDNIKNICETWPYGKRCDLVTTGSPRYDGLTPKDGDYIYFSPPVLVETNPSSGIIIHRKTKVILRKFELLNQIENLVIHPHYREGDIHELKRRFPNAKFIDPADDALEHVRNSRIVISHRNSGTVLDAIACGKRAVLMNFEGGLASSYPRGYFGEMALESSNEEDLIINLNAGSLEYNDEYIATAKPYIHLGSASERLFHAIKRHVG